MSNKITIIIDNSNLKSNSADFNQLCVVTVVYANEQYSLFLRATCTEIYMVICQQKS